MLLRTEKKTFRHRYQQFGPHLVATRKRLFKPKAQRQCLPSKLFNNTKFKLMPDQT